MRNASAFILAPPRARPRPIPGVVFSCERSRDPAYVVWCPVVLSGASYTSLKTSLPCHVTLYLFPFGISLSRVEMFC